MPTLARIAIEGVTPERILIRATDSFGELWRLGEFILCESSLRLDCTGSAREQLKIGVIPQHCLNHALLHDRHSGKLLSNPTSISRRLVLRVGAAAALSPLIRVPLHAGDPPCNGSITETDLALLEKALPGRVLFAAHGDYPALSRSWNGRHLSRPIAVVRAADASDVSAAVQWARVRDVAVVARSGGHSYIGDSIGNGIIVDVSPMSSIAFNARSGQVRVGGGTRLGPLYSSLYCEHGQRTITSGSGSSVGVSGITLGGGYNSSSRLFGLTIDALRAAEVVLADGSIVQTDSTHEPDLFWAIRGGGASFGIVTALEFETRPWVPLAVVTMTWAWADAATAFAAWSQWIASLPAGATSSSTWVSSGTKSSQRFRTTVRSVGGSVAATALADSLEKAVGAISTRVASVSTAPVCGDDGIATGAPSKNTSLLPTDDVPLAAAAQIASAIEARIGTPNLPRGDVAQIFSHAFGGVVAAVGVGDTAFPHRGARMITQLISGWSNGATAARVDANIAWLRNLHSALRPAFGPSCYLNYADEGVADWRTAYWGANLPRLEQIKRAYDPSRYWRGKQFV